MLTDLTMPSGKHNLVPAGEPDVRQSTSNRLGYYSEEKERSCLKKSGENKHEFA
jgi:hypothetical protein